MHKVKHYIALLTSAILFAGITVYGKHTPGIPPVDNSRQAVSESPIGESGVPGIARRELDLRTPGKMVNTLYQKDGILDFRPEMLTGLNPSSDISAFIRRLPAKSIPGGSNLCGFIAYNELNLANGIYRLPITGTQAITELRNTTKMLSAFHGGAASDRYYVMSYYGTTVMNGTDQCLTAIFDKSDWSLLAESGDYGEYERISSDMTYDPATDRFYGCFLNRSQSQWVLGYMQTDPSNPASTVSTVRGLSGLEVSLNGIAADNNGILWGIRNDNGMLVTIDKKTGAMTNVAATGLVPRYNGSLTWDTTNGILYWSVTYDDAGAPTGKSSAILSVDTLTGTLHHVYDYAAPAQTCGLYTEFTAPGGTPGEFTGFRLDFEKESLSGTVNFDAPSTLTDGSAAAGTFNYLLSIVKENGYVAYRQEHTCNFGEKNISVPVTLKTPGFYTFTIQSCNDAGNGYPKSLNRYVGSDLPQNAENLKLTYTDGKITVTWDPVSATIHGGYFDLSDVSYTVSLSQIDADGNITRFNPVKTHDTNAEWEVADNVELRGYQATVIPVAGSNEGEPSISPYIWFGCLRAPFVQTMTSQTDGWTIFTVAGSSWQKQFTTNGKGWAIPYIWGSKNNSWLFSPPIRMEKGRYYTMSFKTWSQMVDMSLHVWIGKAATIEGMATKLTDTQVQGQTTSANPQTVTFGFACPETGIYYLGLHNDTKSDIYTNAPYMWVNDVTCDEAPDSAPSAPVLDVDYDKAGAISAAITITAPSKTYSGTDITMLDNVTLTVNGNVVHVWDTVAPGSILTFHYDDTQKGNHTFIAEATYNGVNGVPAINTTFLGMDAPVDPVWVKSVERSDNPGMVDVTWATVDKVANGQQVADSAISYNVINVLANSYIQRNVTEQPFTFRACEPEEQTALLIAVNAETSAGTSSTYGTYSEQSIMHAGNPYRLPFREDFSDGHVHYSWSVVNQYSAYDHIEVINTATSIGTVDANGDGYCLSAFVPYGNTQASLYSGVIEIPADAHNPVIGFAIFRAAYSGSDENNNTLAVSIIGTGLQGSLAPVTVGSQNYGWQYYYYDMSQFKGQKVNLLFTFQTKSYTTHYIDDIHFFDAPKKDLAITKVTGPEQATPNEKFSISVGLTNLGTMALPQNNAIIELLRVNDNKVVATADIPALSPFQSAIVTLNDVLNNSFDTEVVYRATAVYSGDSKTENDSRDATVTLDLPHLPAPHSLEGTRNDSGRALLSWDYPDLSPHYPEMLIDFEDSKIPSMTDMAGFKSIDVDGNKVYSELGLSGSLGFTTFPHSALARSGSWMLVSPCNEDGQAKEDWLISPRLSGRKQTITFYARTNWNAYETFSVLTSSTGDNKEDFTTTALQMTTSTNDWQRVEITVPEGTLYFAIVCKADDTTDLIYLMLDDFTFEGADINAGLIPEGYNTYRDNELADEAADSITWTDMISDSGPHYYRVTARYAGRGESKSSNEIFLFTRVTGIDNVQAVTGKVYSLPGRIIIENADGCHVNVTGMNGIVIFNTAYACGKESVEVPAGVYLVSIDGHPVKIMVK